MDEENDFPVQSYVVSKNLHTLIYYVSKCLNDMCITVCMRRLPSACVQVGRCLTVSVQECQSWPLLCTQLEAVCGSLTGQEVPDQLNLTILHYWNATRTQIRKLLNPTEIPADRINVSDWPIIPASHSPLQPFVCAGSPRPLGCGHVSVWPPRRPFPSLF